LQLPFFPSKTKIKKKENQFLDKSRDTLYTGEEKIKEIYFFKYI